MILIEIVPEGIKKYFQLLQVVFSRTVCDPFSGSAIPL